MESDEENEAININVNNKKKVEIIQEMLVENENNKTNEESQKILSKKSMKMTNQYCIEQKNNEKIERKFNIVDVKPDGNCLFRCFSKFFNSNGNLLNGTENKHLDIRKNIVKYVYLIGKVSQIKVHTKMLKNMRSIWENQQIMVQIQKLQFFLNCTK